MTEVLGVAEAKRRFSELIERVQRGERFVVARRGRPVVALVRPDEQDDSEPAEYVGLIGLVGAMADWPEFGEVMDEVYASRRGRYGRDVPYFDDAA